MLAKANDMDGFEAKLKAYVLAGEMHAEEARR
jgi:hypothetical protein